VVIGAEAAQGVAERSFRAPRRTRPVNGMRISRNASTETKKPRKIKARPAIFATEYMEVEPMRDRLSPLLTISPPSAIYSVAVTRLWMWPVKSATIAPGRDRTKFTGIATTAMIRLNRNWSPFWPGSSEYGRKRFLGMNT
jgi:hypothetical protein